MRLPGKRLDWMVLKMFIPPFLMGFMIVLFILVLQFLALYMNQIFGKGLTLAILGQLFFYAAGRLLLTALPVALMIGGLMAFGSMGEHYELASLKSCGINMIKTMRSVLVFGIALTLSAIFLSFDIIPQANLKLFSLLYDIKRKKPDMAIRPGYFYSDIDNYVIRISDKNPDTGILYDVLIYDHSSNQGNSDVIKADSAIMKMDDKVMKMVLYHGLRHEKLKSKGPNKTYPYGRTYFDSLYYQFNLSGFDLNRTDESQFKHQIVMPYSKLGFSLDSLDDVKTKYYNKSLQQLARYHKVDSLFLGRQRDTLEWDAPYVSWELGEEDSLLGCFDLNTQLTLIGKAQVNARSVKSYLEFMRKKREDHERTVRSYEYEYYLRVTMPLNLLLFLLIGVSFGAIIRKGGLGPPALVSLTFFLLFYILLTQGKKFSREGLIDPWFGAWIPLIFMAVVAAIVTYQATMDSKILDNSEWGKFFKKFGFGVLFGGIGGLLMSMADREEDEHQNILDEVRKTSTEKKRKE